MYIQRIQQTQGATFSAYERFARAHPNASFFQSPEFFRELISRPETEPVLLLAVKGEKLRDPGQRYQQDAATAHRSPGEATGPPLVAASMLAAIVKDRPPLRRRWSPYTLVYDGPLVAEGTRLENEKRLRALLEALAHHVRRQPAFIQVHILFGAWDMLPLLKEMGYERADKMSPAYNNLGTPWLLREFPEHLPEGITNQNIFSRATGRFRFLFR